MKQQFKSTIRLSTDQTAQFNSYLSTIRSILNSYVHHRIERHDMTSLCERAKAEVMDFIPELQTWGPETFIILSPNKI